MSPEEAITHWQCSLLLYDPGPSEMVPSEAPEEGEHEQLPEHVMLETALYLPVAQSTQTEAPGDEYFPATQSLHAEPPFTLNHFPAAQSLQLPATCTDHVASKPL